MPDRRGGADWGDSPVRVDAFSEQFFGRKNEVVDEILGFWFNQEQQGGGDEFDRAENLNNVFDFNALVDKQRARL